MADIGDKLRSAREAKGLSIADIEKATKIQGRYLTAIEQNDFDKLPGDFYVRAFIRQYAQIVGLDGKQLLSEYHQEVPAAQPDEYVEDSIDNKSEEVRKTTSNKKKLWKNYLPRIIVGLGVIGVILVCYVVYAHFSASHNQDVNPDKGVSISSGNTNKPKKKQPVVANSVKIKELAANQFQITGLKKNRNLVVRAGDQSITVTISFNGVRQASQTLAAGQKQTIAIPTNAQNVGVNLSNASGTKVTVGGKKVPYDDQNGYLNLTLLIGKQRSQTTSQSNSTNNYRSNTNNGTNSTNSSQSTHSSNNQATHNNSTNNNSQHNQTTQNNGQSNNQTNTTNNGNQSGSSTHSSTTNNGR
ncbi:helix-turn-helix domain-containing protein [Lactobacillus sp. ESL0679]|uniref:helix-turn-helix domain-containing protein n=1 Tax=Lactobacillus sp. ESL0679 TaxID=2983209 RepID=UPI0023F64AF2|nr:RodZ family helix-turn-helix domain-containing protein [Lactobacillus sp. ESL0679]MDF7683695.1 helix-turn-helix domain-containing protein [Lactobacillus sp. ESL0679]